MPPPKADVVDERVAQIELFTNCAICGMLFHSRRGLGNARIFEKQ